MISIYDWFFVNLGDANLSQSQLIELESDLTNIYKKSGNPKTMLAVFRYESQDLHCHIKLFLTGDFQRVVMLKEAVQCSEPNPNSVSYLAGNSEFWIER